MNRGRVGEERGGKENGCPLTSTVVTSPLLQVAWMSCVNDWENEVSMCLLRKNVSLSAMIFSRTLLMHFSSWMRQ
jgi:hypothetical protein